VACREWQGHSFAEAVWAGVGRAGVDVGASAGLELVDEFCCLGDMLGVGGGAGAAVEARIRVGWSGFGQLVPLLAGGDVSLVVRGGLCGGGAGAAVVSCIGLGWVGSVSYDTYEMLFSRGRGGVLHGCVINTVLATTCQTSNCIKQVPKFRPDWTRPHKVHWVRLVEFKTRTGPDQTSRLRLRPGLQQSLVRAKFHCMVPTRLCRRPASKHVSDINPFYHMLARYMLSSCVRPSVCLYVRLSQAGIMSKPLNLESRF